MDSCRLTLCHDPNQEEGTSLDALCHRYLGLNLDKSRQDDDYFQSPLPTRLIEYAALDVLVSHQLAEKLAVLTSTSCLNGVLFSPAGLMIKDKVEVFLYGKIAAEAEVDFGGGDGYVQKWEMAVIGLGKALI